jgi:hypothetical protein
VSGFGGGLRHNIAAQKAAQATIQILALWVRGLVSLGSAEDKAAPAEVRCMRYAGRHPECHLCRHWMRAALAAGVPLADHVRPYDGVALVDMGGHKICATCSANTMEAMAFAEEHGLAVELVFELTEPATLVPRIAEMQLEIDRRAKPIIFTEIGPDGVIP